MKPFRPSAEALEGREVPAALFVSTAGNDANPGTAAQPWKTLQKAANVVQPGDVVTVRAGSYAGFQMYTSGTPDARIVFKADPGVNITSPNPVWKQDGVNLEGASYVTVDGFAALVMPRAGFRAVNSTGVVFRNNKADNNFKWGIFTGFSSNLLIENNVTNRSWTQHGIYVSNSADDVVIRGNKVASNWGSGIQINADVWSGGDGIISRAVVENNVLYDNGKGGGASINLDGVQDSVVRNNLITNAHASGVVLYKYNGASGSKNNVVANNTVLLAPDGRWAVYSSGGSTGNVYRNNVLFSGHTSRGAFNVSSDSLPGLVSDSNAVEDLITLDDGGQTLTLAQWRARTGQDARSFAVADPAPFFANPAAGDYHLKPGSALVDAGTAASAPPADAEGTPRPSGAAVDIGHDELLAPNTAPTVSAVSGQSVVVGGTTGPIAFTVGDAETPAGSLAVTAASSNGALLPPAGIVLGGSGADRTVTVTPAAGQAGVVTVTLTVTDAGGLTATRAFTVTVAPPAGAGKPYAVGTDGGPVAAVTLYNADGTVRFTARPFGNAYAGGARVAVGDVTGDGVADVVAGTNGGTYGQVKVVDGATGQVLAPNLLGTVWTTGAVSVAAGDVDGDGVMDVAAGTDDAGLRVRVYKGGTWAALADFKAGPTTDCWGKTAVALGDVTGDGTADLVVAGAYADGVRLFGWDGATLRAGVTPARAFADQALGTAFGSGVFLAAGDVTGDGFADVVVGAGGWGNGKVTAYSGKSLVQTGARAVVADFAPPGVVAAKGVRVAARDVDGDGKADILTGAGATAAVWWTASLAPAGLPPLFRQHDTGLTAGIFVG